MSPANDNVEQEKTDVTGDGPWKDASLDQIKREFNAFRKTNAYPERFKGVARNVKPPIDRPFRIVCSFSVREEARDGQRAPCNVCLNLSKFVTHGRLIVDENGWLYFVGPDCAATYFDDGSYVRGERAFRSREDSERAIEFLLEAIPAVPRWTDLATKLQPFVSEVDRAHKLLLSRAPNFVTEVRAAYVDGGLAVDQIQMVRPANGKEYPRRIRRIVSRMSGRIALNTHCDVVRQLELGIGQIRLFALKSDDETVDLLADFEAAGKLLKARAMLGSAIGHIEKARDQVLQHRAFYAAANFEALKQWNFDANGPRRFDVEVKGNTRTIHELGGGRFWINFERLLGTVPGLE